MVSEFPVLGMTLSADGSIRRDVEELRRQVQKAAVRNLASAGSKELGVHRRLKLVGRAVLPLLRFRGARWPPSPSLARKLDSMQRRCIILAQNLPRHTDEPMETWARRRSRTAARHASHEGLWSKTQIKLTQSWLEHVERERNKINVSSWIFPWKNQQWRAQRRLAMGSPASHSGRLASRRVSHVNIRWEDAVRSVR